MDALVSKAHELQGAMHQKKVFFEVDFVNELANQARMLEVLANDQSLNDVVEEARFMRQYQEKAAEAFFVKYSILIEGELMRFMSTPNWDHEATNILTLQDLCAQIMMDPDLNVADPVWIMLLHVLVNVRTRGMGLTSWSSCCVFINGCHRWTPDDRFLTSEIRRALATCIQKGAPPHHI